MILATPALALALLQSPELAVTFSALREDSTRLGGGAALALPITSRLRWLADTSWHREEEAGIRHERLLVGTGVDLQVVGSKRLSLSAEALIAWARESERIQILDVDLVHHQNGLAALVGAKLDIRLGGRFTLRLAQVDAVMTRRDGNQTLGARGATGLVVRHGGSDR